MLQDWEVDDGLFSTVVAWGQAESTAELKQKALAHYRTLLPQGRHQTEADEWALRFAGRLPTTFSKPRD